MKVVEVCDGFTATREQKQKDQRDGRRAAPGRGDWSIMVVKTVWRGVHRNQKELYLSGESPLFTSAVANNSII